MHNSDQIRKDTKLFYDTVADRFSETRSRFWHGFDFIRKYLKKEGKVLDFGCGNGRLLELLDADMDYIGVDISSELIKLAQKKSANRRTERKFMIIEDEQKLPFEDDQFDLIFAIAVFHHFTPEMAKESIKELRRVLKKDGVIIISVWNLWNWKYLKYLFRGVETRLIASLRKKKFLLGAKVPFDSQKGIFWRFCYWWTQKKLGGLIEGKGFTILEKGYTMDKNKKKRNLYFAVKK